MQEPKVDLSKYENHLGRKHQVIRFIWRIIWPAATWFLPRILACVGNVVYCVCFGLRYNPSAIIYSSADIYYPANLITEEYSCLGSDVDYNIQYKNHHIK